MDYVVTGGRKIVQVLLGTIGDNYTEVQFGLVGRSGEIIWLKAIWDLKNWNLTDPANVQTIVSTAFGDFPYGLLANE